MKSRIFLVVLYCLSFGLTKADKNYHFIENKGQWSEHVGFTANIPNGTIQLEKNRLTYHFTDYSEVADIHLTPSKFVGQELRVKGHVYHVNFIGANNFTQLIPDNELSAYYNFYQGNDPSFWASGVKAFQKVQYQNLYNKIDLLFHEKEGFLKYDIILQPGAELSDLKFEYEGLNSIKLKKGELIIETSLGQVIEEKPYAYQTINGVKKEISCIYKLNKNVLSFEIQDEYDHSRPIVIDPTLVFATYSGIFSDNFGMTATYDNAGNFYSGGIIFGNIYGSNINNFPLPGSYDNAFDGSTVDVVITKYDPTGANILFWTYMGGSGTEAVHSLIVNDNDELYIYGSTGSVNWPTLANSYDNTHNGGSAVNLTQNGLNFTNGTDIYVAKFNASGTSLLGSTYIGGSGNDGLNYVSGNPAQFSGLVFNYGDQFRGEIMLDSLGFCYIASSTKSNDFPTINAYDNTLGGDQDGVVFKFNNDLSALIWSTYLGGSLVDASYSIKLDNNLDVYVVGGTVSPDFPITTGTLNTTFQGGQSDGYVTKLSSIGNTVLNSTFIGTNGYDQCYFVEIDRWNGIYLLGQSEGNYPVLNVGYSDPGSGQFISKLDNNLSAYDYSTVFGNGSGQSQLSPSAFLVDRCLNVYISGWGGNIISQNPMTGMPTTTGALFPSSPNGFDYYFAVFEQDLNSMLYGSYFGGTQSQEHVDGGTSRFDKKGVIYQSVCAGCGSNDDFPTSTGAWSNVNNSNNCNNGMFKFDFQIDVQAIFSNSDTAGCAPLPVFFNNLSNGGDIYTWDFGNGLITNVLSDTTIVFTDTGTFVVQLVVYDTICNIQDTTQRTITIFPAINLLGPLDTTICQNDTSIFMSQSFGTADTFIYSTNINFSDTLNPILTDSVLNLTGGTTGYYYVKIVNGICSKVDSFYLNINTLNSNITNTVNTTCGGCSGSATINVGGGFPGYTYQWDDSLLQTTITATGLCVGVYNINVVDSIGCTTSAQIIISDTSNLLTTLVDSLPISCPGDCNASVEVGQSGGTSPYTYQWDTSASNQTTAIATGLCAGTYSVIVTDSNNCKGVLSVVVSGPPLLGITGNIFQQPTCFSDCDGSITIAGTGGTPGYTYQWDDPNTQITVTATGLCAGAYSVTIIDSQGCFTDTTLVLSDPPELNLDVVNQSPSCDNDCDGIALAIVSGGTPSYIYSWDIPINPNTDSLLDLCPGVYTVSVVDSSGCLKIDSVRISNNNFGPFDLNLSVDDDTILRYESTIIHANPGGTGNYYWEPGNSLSDPNDLNTVASPLQTTEYEFIIEDPNNPNCFIDGTVKIVVLDFVCGDEYVYVPNAFTPNGDNQNDVLYLRARNLTDIYFTVYDRWGEMMFETKTLNKGWDGTYKGKEADPAVFVYYVTGTCAGGEEFFRKGNITLIR